VSGSPTSTTTLYPQTATLTLCQSQQFAANAPGGTTLQWSVDNVVGGTSSVGTITSSGLYTAPQSAGTHVVTAVGTGYSAQSSVAVTDLSAIWTHRFDNARDGLNQHEYALTPSTVSSGNFAKLWSCAVDGDVYAQPLYVAGLAIAGGTHNVLFVATHNDSVYAFDADSASCQVLWQVSFLGGVNNATVSQQTCGDTKAYGITPTPVIDMTTQTIYVLVATTEMIAGNSTFVQRLHAMSLSTGVDTMTAVMIQATASGNTQSSQGSDTFNAAFERPRPGMTLSNGGVYLGWGSFCDDNPWNGWFMRYDAATLTQTVAFNASPNGFGAGIWMSGGAPAVDSSGAIYLTTGNGTFDDTSSTVPPVAPNNDLSMSVLKFDPTSLTVLDFFAPEQEAAWSENDWDVSSVGVTVLPDGTGPAGHPQLLLSGDKEGHVYLIDRDNGMGEFSSIANNVVQFLTIPNIMSGCVANYASACIYSTPSYYNGTVYVGATLGPLLSLPITNGILPTDQSGNVAPASQTNETYQYPGPFSTISASPSGGGLVWVLDNSNCATDDCAANLGAAILRSYNASNLGTTLYSSTTVAADAAASAIKYTQPVIANGHVYVGGSGAVTVYGLAP
jgi:hypothetical protein